jgi:hypothetical protein
MISTNTMSRGLLKLPPAFNPCDVWIVDKRSKRREWLWRPSVCPTPVIAKNSRSGAKKQPRYKWMDRSFCMARPCVSCWDSTRQRQRHHALGACRLAARHLPHSS